MARERLRGDGADGAARVPVGCRVYLRVDGVGARRHRAGAVTLMSAQVGRDARYCEPRDGARRQVASRRLGRFGRFEGLISSG